MQSRTSLYCEFRVINNLYHIPSQRQLYMIWHGNVCILLFSIIAYIIRTRYVIMQCGIKSINTQRYYKVTHYTIYSHLMRQFDSIHDIIRNNTILLWFEKQRNFMWHYSVRMKLLRVTILRVNHKFHSFSVVTPGHTFTLFQHPGSPPFCGCSRWTFYTRGLSIFLLIKPDLTGGAPLQPVPRVGARQTLG